jgi:hypothetical protein
MTKFGKLLLIVILIVILAVVIFFFQKPATEVNPLPEDVIQREILGNKDDLISFSILPNGKVYGVMTFQGSIKDAYFFEANILINILDADKNVLKASNATAMTDWMTSEPVSFEGDIDFTGLPKGLAYIEIHNDNASGLPENDKSILIPVVIE